MDSEATTRREPGRAKNKVSSELSTDSTINMLLEKLQGVRSNSHGKWLARCPAHDDKSPSLSIKLTDDGKILIHCFAGCHVTKIVESLGLTLADLMPNNWQPLYEKNSKSPKPPKFSRYELFDLLAFESLILSIGIRQLLDGKKLDQDDLKRIDRAELFITEICREVRRP